MKGERPLIAITMGDPRGIGPEIIVKALSQIFLRQTCVPLIIGDLNILKKTARAIKIKLNFAEVQEEDKEFDAETIPVLSLTNISLAEKLTPDKEQECARASFLYIEKGAQMAMAQKVAALVTAPVSKEAIWRAGIPFRGHTDYLAKVSQTKDYAMMLAGEKLKVSLVTTHLPFRKVVNYLTAERVQKVIELTAQGLRDFFQMDKPHIGVAALNPHGGEKGLLGEEEEMIRRAVQGVKREGFSLSGPWPADTIFYRAYRGEFAAVVCMYHDQGLIPLKLLHFEDAVNITLGLPFIRTSVDHGVAFDIAGQGRASATSLQKAISLAVQTAWQKRPRAN
ncbi:MAG: 4-hydroxythreonine-4-phosphate dehydrogenase PdxA [Thermodesulfobacteriota bacterium]